MKTKVGKRREMGKDRGSLLDGNTGGRRRGTEGEIKRKIARKSAKRTAAEELRG